MSRNRPRIYLEERASEEASLIAQTTVAARPHIFARIRAGVGGIGLWLAHICCFVLVWTLAWGPLWPFKRWGINAPHHGVLNTAFDPADVLFMGIVAGWGLALISGQDRIGSPPRRITRPLLLFALAGGFAVVGAMHQTKAIHFAIRSAALAVLYLYVHRGLSTRRLTPATLARWLVPGLAFNGLLAIAQFVHQNPVGLAWLGEPDTLRATFGTPVVLVHGTRLLRAFGILPHPNVLGGLLAAALPLVAGLLLRPEASGSEAMARRIGRGRAIRDVLLLLGVVLMSAGIMLSFSRSAWIGLLCGGLYLIVRRFAGNRTAIIGNHNAIAGPYTKRGVLVVASIALVVVGLLLAEWNAVSVRLQPAGNRLERTSIQQRLSLLELSFKVISWRPVTGVGGDNFVLAADRFLPPNQRGQSTQYPVHNTYLLAEAELGPLGGVAWLALMLVPLLGLSLRGFKRRPAPAVWVTSAARGAPLPLKQGIGQAAWTQWQGLAGCSLIVVAVVGLFDWYIWGSGPGNEPVAVLWVVALALFTAPAHEPYTLRQSERRRASPIVIALVLLGILAASVGGFEYLYRDRALPNVIVSRANINVGGQTQDVTALRLRPFSLKQRFRTIALIAQGRAPILIPAYKLGYSIDNGLTAWRAYNVGHSGSTRRRLMQQARTLMNGATVNIAQRVDEITLRNYLFKLQGAVNRPPRPSVPGRALDVAPAQRQITRLLLHTVGAFRVYLPFVSRPALPVPHGLPPR